jgi:hypothetical protein
MDDPYGGDGEASNVSPAMLQILWERLVAEELADSDRPHVLISSDAETDSMTVTGPYPNGMAAAAAAEIEHANDLSRLGIERIYRLAPLLPPHEPYAATEPDSPS